MSIPKCILGVAWTSALIAIAISTVMFSLFDIGTAIESLGIDIKHDNLVLKAFVFTSILIWLLLWSSVLLNCFYNSLRNSNCGCESNDCEPENKDTISEKSTA